MDIDPELLGTNATVHIGALNMAPTGFPASGSGEPHFAFDQSGQAQDGDETEDSASAYEESEDSEVEMDGDERPAKTQDESNLDKLIQSVFRGGQRQEMLDPQAPAGRLGESWDQSIKDVLEDLDEEAGDMHMRSGRKRKRRRRRPRTQVVLSAEVQAMLSAANTAYMTREYDTAVELLQEIIRIEPAARPAYHTLSAIHTELGNHDKSLQLDILAGHLAGRAPELWKDLGARSREAGLLQQAVYCLTQAITSVDERDDVDALWDRSIILLQLGELKKATAGFHALLKIHPNDPNIIREMVPVLLRLGEHAQALTLLSDSFADQVQRFPEGPASANPMLYLLGMNDLHDLVELQKHQGHYMDAIRIIRTGQRWFQGRATHGQAWELYEDDREYDLQRKSRPRWEQEERLRWLEDLPPIDLDPLLRGNLAVCRLLSGNKAEADVQTLIIRSTIDIYDYPEIYTELADTYFDKGHHEQACDLYMDLGECQTTNVPAVWTRVAQCHRHMGNLEDARQCFESVICSDAADLNVKLQLAEVYDELGHRAKALELVNEVLEGRRLMRAQEEEAREQQAQLDNGEEEEENAEEATLFPERARQRKRRKTGKLTRDQRLEMEMERMGDIEIGLDRLRRIEEDLEDPKRPFGSKEWLDAASFLVDNFRETPSFFPNTGVRKRSLNTAQSRNRRLQREKRGRNLDADADDLAERLQRAMDDENAQEEEAAEGRKDNSMPHDAAAQSWCGLDFDKWISLAVTYACALTLNDEHPEAVEVLRHIATSAIAKEGQLRRQAIWIGLATCAFHAGKRASTTLELRRVMRAGGEHSEVLRAMQALLASGHQSWAGWSNTNMQKYILRSIQMIDRAAGEHLGKQKQNSPSPAADSPAEDEEPGEEDDLEEGSNETFKRTKVDPYYVVQYANVLLGARGYSSAIFYYLRLLDMFPDDPLLHLLTGCAYLMRSIQRQVDNRHHATAQAFACFSQYRKMRRNEAEANYNFGRAFQQIGLNSLAIRHYEAVLDEERHRREAEMEALPGGLAKYAAYNLYLVYLTSGVGELAKRVSDEWLAF